MLFRRRRAPSCTAEAGGHTAHPEELEDLKKDPEFPIETECTACGREIAISSYKDDPDEFYWVTEL